MSMTKDMGTSEQEWYWVCWVCLLFFKIWQALPFLPRHLLVPRSIGVVWSYPSHLPASPETLAGVLDYMNSHFWSTQVDSAFFEIWHCSSCFFHTNSFTRVQAGLVCNAEDQSCGTFTGREVLCFFWAENSFEICKRCVERFNWC